MTVTLSSTTQIVEINGIECRMWEGATLSGIRVQALIPRIAVHKSQDASEFERELIEQDPPREPGRETAFPLRMVI